MCDQARGCGLVYLLYRALRPGEERLGFHSRYANDNIDGATFAFMQGVAEALLRPDASRVRRGRKRSEPRR